MTAPTTQPRPISRQEFALAENPLWDPGRARLLWTDIDAGTLWQWRPGDTEARCLYEGPRVGGFTLQPDGALLLFRETDVALLEPGAEPRVLVPFEDPRCERFNDVIAAPDGSVFAGAIGRDDDAGGLFRLAIDGQLTELFRDTRIPNGMAFSRDRRTLFYTCSTSATISRFALDPETSTLADRRVIHRAAPDQGTPDGLAIDADENLWSARWGGRRIIRMTAEGDIEGAIDLPVDNVTSAAFGGPELEAMFITTAGGPLFVCEPGVAGRPEFRSNIQPA